VRTLNRELRMTVVLASHQSEEVAEFADRVALLARGRIVRVAPSAAFFQEVEDLTRHQVRPPQVTEFFHCLHKRGLVLDSLPVTLPRRFLPTRRHAHTCASARGRSPLHQRATEPYALLPRTSCVPMLMGPERSLE
jgi:ABC-type sulfate/molybdate transport systems ATPase subunit